MEATKRQYVLRSGYAFRYDLHDGLWAGGSDENWDTVLTTQRECDSAEYVGCRSIDGTVCAVFRVPGSDGPEYLAQMAHHCRS